MATKSIIEIEIKDDAFKRHQAAMEKYRATVKESLGEWGKLGGAAKQVGTAWDKIGVKIKATKSAFADANTIGGKFVLTLKAADRTMTSIGKGALFMARNIGSATASLLKWASVTSLITGALGAFGLSKLAGNVSAGQQASRETGSTYGQTKGAQSAYGQLLGGEGGVQSILAKINEARQAYGMVNNKPVFAMAGMKEEDWQGKTSAEILPKYLEAIQKQFAAQTAMTGGKGQAMMAQHTGATDILDIGQLTALSKTNLSELAKQAKIVQRQTELGEKTQTAWANLERALDAAGSSMSSTFAKALQPLIPALSKFADAVSSAMSSLMGNGKMQEWIEKAGAALGKFVNYLTSPEFPKAIENFLAAIDRLAGSMYGIIKWVSKFTGGDSRTYSEQAKAERFDKFGGKISEDYQSSLKAKADKSLFGENRAEGRMLEGIRSLSPDKQREAAQSMIGETVTNTKLAQAISALTGALMVKGKEGYTLTMNNQTGGNLNMQMAAGAH